MWQRWNQTTHIFEKSLDNGGSWTPLGLDAAILTEGLVGIDRVPVLTKAKQHAQTAYKDEANTFTLEQVLSFTRATLRANAGATGRFGRLQGLTGSQFGFSQNCYYDGAVKIDDTTKSGWFCRVIDSGEGDQFEVFRCSPGVNPRPAVELFRINSNGTIFERGRPTGLGEWAAYTAVRGAASGTWSGGSATTHYTVIGRTCILMFFFSATSISAATSSINFTTPGGYTPSINVVHQVTIRAYNGTWSTGYAYAQNTGHIVLHLDQAATPWAIHGDTYVIGQIIYQF